MHIGLCPGNFDSGTTRSSPLSDECSSFHSFLCVGACALRWAVFPPLWRFLEQVEGSVASGSSRGRYKRMGNKKAAGWTVRCPKMAYLCFVDMNKLLF